MLFNSYVFLFYFLPITIVGYYLLAHYANVDSAKIWLAASSFVFYGWWNVHFVPMLLASIAVNYALSLKILSTEERPELQLRLLQLGVVLNVGTLVYFKYLFVSLAFFHTHGWLDTDYGQIILPLGISFFTFTQIGYLVDCQQGLVRERGLVDYVLFVTFFPHLIAGPILHHREIMPQFADPATYRLSEQKIAVGMTLFVFGLVKKVVLADSISPWADAGFAHVGTLGALSAWSSVMAFLMQLYFDFSGYSDMAIGLGIMFGIRLPLNFNSPLKSPSIIEFWQRWHMTLTRYLTLLLFNPISIWVTRKRMERGLPTNRRAAETLSGFLGLIAFPTFTTMFLAGIWHGAGFTFLIFGLLHATYLIGNHVWRVFHSHHQKQILPWWRVAFTHFWKIGLTVLGVLLSNVFFRAANISDAFRMLGSAFGLNGQDLPLRLSDKSKILHIGFIRDFLLDHNIAAISKEDVYGTVTRPLLSNLVFIVGLALVIWGAPNVNQILGEWNPALQTVPKTRWRFILWQPNLAWAVAVGVMLFYVLTRLDHPGRFLYFQF